MNIYAIYKGEKFLFEGTTKECTNFLKVKENTIYFLNNICYKKRIGTKRKNGLIDLELRKNNMRKIGKSKKGIKARWKIL